MDKLETGFRFPFFGVVFLCVGFFFVFFLFCLVVCFFFCFYIYWKPDSDTYSVLPCMDVFSRKQTGTTYTHSRGTMLTGRMHNALSITAAFESSVICFIWLQLISFVINEHAQLHTFDVLFRNTPPPPATTAPLLCLAREENMAAIFRVFARNLNCDVLTGWRATLWLLIDWLISGTNLAHWILSYYAYSHWVPSSRQNGWLNSSKAAQMTVSLGGWMRFGGFIVVERQFSG